MKKTASRATRTDGELTRSRILEAAGQLIAISGYGATSNKAIAKKAEVDLASINYHFGSREGLYQAVLLESHQRLINLDKLWEIASSSLPPREKLGSVIRYYLKASLGKEEWHANVFAREILSSTSNLHFLFNAEIKPKLKVIIQILGDITGIPEGDPALLRCFISTFTPCLVLLLTRKDLPDLFPLQQLGHMPQQALVDHLTTFALAGLEAISSNYRESRAKP